MEANQVEIFIKGTANYFSIMTDSPANVEAPFLKEDFIVPGDFTGTIGISGDQKGYISFTAKRSMIEDLLAEIGEETNEDALISDLVGEIANIISGNAREYFGTGFLISVPVVIVGPASSVHVTQELSTFIIPINWNNHTAYLTLSLEDLTTNSHI